MRSLAGIVDNIATASYILATKRMLVGLKIPIQRVLKNNFFIVGNYNHSQPY